jgi:hypothetical protein
MWWLTMVVKEHKNEVEATPNMYEEVWNMHACG